MIDKSEIGKPDTAMSDPHTRQPNETPAIDRAELSKLAHELKTPLSAIAAAAEIMRDERFGIMNNPRYRDYASDIHDNARHALAVISRMLAGYAADASDRLAATPLENLELNALAANCVAAIEPVAAARNRKLKFVAAGELPTIQSNSTIIRQILLNLLTNAIKYAGPDSDIRVETGLLPTGDPYLVVRDTGPGMSGQTLARTQARSTNIRQQPDADGQGIGIPLVRELAGKISATFDLDSTIGKGTVALLSFPAKTISPRPAVIDG